MNRLRTVAHDPTWAVVPLLGARRLVQRFVSSAAVFRSGIKFQRMTLDATGRYRPAKNYVRTQVESLGFSTLGRR